MQFLLEKAAAPFFEMLEKWIYKGLIQDTYGEFFVEEHEGMRKEELIHDYNDAYPWISHYSYLVVTGNNGTRLKLSIFLPFCHDLQTRFLWLVNIWTWFENVASRYRMMKQSRLSILRMNETTLQR